MHTSSVPSAERNKALVLATLAFALCFAVWGLIAPLAPLFRDLFQLSATETGVLVATPVILGALLRIPMGILTDCIGGRLVFSLLIASLVVPLALIGLSSSYWMLLLGAFWLGLSGSSFAVGVPFVSRWFPPQRQGYALGIYGTGNAGTALAAILVPTLSGLFGWPAAFWLFVPPLLLMAATFWLLARDAPEPTGRVLSVVERIAVVRGRPVSWVLSLMYFVTFGGFVAISIYLPTLLVQVYNLDWADAGARTAGFVVLATLARPLGGYLADRTGGTVILQWVFITSALLAVLLTFQPGITLAAAGFLGIAFVFGLGNGAVFKLVAQLFPRDTGTITGIVGAAGGLGGFFPPIILGIARDATGSYAAGFVLLAVMAAACFLLVRYLGKKEREAAAGGEVRG